MHGGEAAESGFDLAVGGGGGQAEVGVEVALAPELPGGFVDGVEEVEGDDEDLDGAAVAGEAGVAGLGLGVAGADGQGVPDGLGPACDELGEKGGLEMLFWERTGRGFGDLLMGGTTNR